MPNNNEDDSFLFWLLVFLSCGLLLLFWAAANEDPEVYQAGIRDWDAEEQRRRQKEKQLQEEAWAWQQRELQAKIDVAIKKKTLADINPPKPEPLPPRPPADQIRVQKIAEIMGLQNEKAAALASMEVLTNDLNILQGIARAYEDKVQKVMDTL